jgi:anti-sigma factor RsiW
VRDSRPLPSASDPVGMTPAVRPEEVDVELAPGARNAVRVCLAIQPHERVTVITDRASAGIAQSLLREIDAVGAPSQEFVLEAIATRPVTSLRRSPVNSASAWRSPTSSIAGGCGTRTW